MKSWLGMVSMLWADGSEAGRGSQVSVRHTPPVPTVSRCVIAWTLPDPSPEHLLWLRFSTSMFLALSSSRGHSVSWL